MTQKKTKKMKTIKNNNIRIDFLSVNMNATLDNVTYYNTAQGRPRDFYLINGKYAPNICLTAGEWKRLRLINADPAV